MVKKFQLDISPLSPYVQTSKYPIFLPKGNHYSQWFYALFKKLCVYTSTLVFVYGYLYRCITQMHTYTSFTYK